MSAFATFSQITASIENVVDPAPLPKGYVSGTAIPLAIRTTNFRASARQVKALRSELMDIAPDYPLIAQPVEILHGTEDFTVRAEIHAEPLARLLPNARLTLLDGIGHAPRTMLRPCQLSRQSTGSASAQDCADRFGSLGVIKSKGA